MARYFENIHGNTKLKTMLCSYIENGAMPHAFIIEGAIGSGRKYIAKSIAAALSCKNKDGQSIPCGKCINCEKIFSNVCPDVMTVDSEDKQSIGVELIRELTAHTYMTSNELDMKVYIIDGADTMTVQAQNAFLKTLEEPVTSVLYFLICENAKMLLPTIISRAPIIRTTPLSNDTVSKYITENYPSIDKDKLKNIIALAHGNLGRARVYENDNEARDELSQKREETYALLECLKLKKAKFDVYDYFTCETDNDGALERLRILYSAMRDIIAYREVKLTQPDFFLDTEEISKYASCIKPKHAKKICVHIEQSLAELYLNQGSASVYSIMFTLANNVWNANN